MSDALMAAAPFAGVAGLAAAGVVVDELRARRRERRRAARRLELELLVANNRGRRRPEGIRK